MHELFGVPVDTMLVILGVALVVVLGILAVLALRNRVLLKLAVRNVGRRRGRSALIVVGLMLGTTIIAAALTTGDTMNNTIRSTAVDALGETDETIAPKGAVDDIPGALGAATGTGWLPESVVERVAQAVVASGLTDGVAGVIVEQVAVQAPKQRQSEPSVVLFAADPARMEGFSPIVGSEGDELSLADLRPGEVYLNEKAAKELRVAPGDSVLVFAGRPTGEPALVRDVVRFDGAATADAAMLVPLAAAQELFGHPGEIRAVLVSNRGGATSGAALSDDVVAKLQPVADELGLEVQTVKQDAIDDADEIGAAFIAFFTTFGTFSIAAGILLIFLIFVMLAAERRGELGIARAIGTRRGHLVEMFTFEGAAYDLAGRCRRRAPRRGRRVRDGSRHGPGLRGGRRGRGSPDPVRRVVAQPPHRVRDRHAAHARGRRRVGLARERDDHRDRDPRPARAARSRGADAVWFSLCWESPSASFWSASGTSGDSATPAPARRLARPHEPRAAPPSRGCPRADRVHGLRARGRRLPHAALALDGPGLRGALDGLLDVDRQRAC